MNINSLVNSEKLQLLKSENVVKTANKTNTANSITHHIIMISYSVCVN